MALTPKQRQRYFEKFLTDANNRMSQISEMSGIATSADFKVAAYNYQQKTLTVIQQLETDASGRLLATQKNAELVQVIRDLGVNFRKAPAFIAERQTADLTKMMNSYSRWVGSTAVAAGVVAEAAPLAVILEQAIAATPVKMKLTGLLTPALDSLAGEITTGVENAVVRSLREFAETDGGLAANVFGEGSPEILRERVADMKDRAARFAADMHGNIDAIEKGQKTVEGTLNEVKEKLAKNNEKLKELKKLKKAGATEEAIEAAAKKAQAKTSSEIMSAHQDDLIRNSGKAFNVPHEQVVYVNAKNTDYDDNCWDAAEHEPMTMKEWSEAPEGPPRSGSRDCGLNCKCLLIAVGTVEKPPVISGDQISGTGE